MDNFEKYINNTTENEYSSVSKFWKKEKEYTIKQTGSDLPKKKDIKNLRRWKGRKGCGNHNTLEQFNNSLNRIRNAKIPVSFSKDIFESNFGNPYKNNSDYGEYSGMFLLNLISTYMISNYIDKYTDLKKLDICEIGTGWGQCCEILNQKYDLNSYTSIDLKETLILSYLNAQYNYSSDNINLVDNNKDIKKYNFCIPEKINFLENKKYDY